MYNNKKEMKVPVVILHEMDDTQYKIGGELIAINESDDTCTVRFRNGRVEDSIPMDCIYIREGFLDTVKEYGRKAAAWIISKVKGLFEIDTDNEENAFQHPINMIAAAAEGLTPAWATFYPSQNMYDLAEEAGISYAEPEDVDTGGQAAKEIEDINRFWSRVMNIAGTTDKTIEESIQYVNETYYQSFFSRKALNEAGVPSMRATTDNVKDDAATGAEGRKNNDGMYVNTKMLKSLIYESISGQLKLAYKKMLSLMDAGEAASIEDRMPADMMDDDDDDDDDIMDDPRYEEVRALQRREAQSRAESSDNKTKPLLIWGAPGIGKTEIVRQVIKDFRNHPTTPVTLAMYDMNCANVDGDAFFLPIRINNNGRQGNTTGTKGENIDRATLVWLPVYAPGEEEYNESMEKHFALCEHLTSDGSAMVDNETGEPMQGGVLFFDEIVRAHRSGLVSLMEICDRKLGEKRLARSWAVICAANRASEDVTQEAIDMMESAPIVQRFRHVTFVPEKSEWVEWARSRGKGVAANIEPEIVNFVEAMPDYIWYRTLDNGGYQKEEELVKGELDIDGQLYSPEGGGVYQDTVKALKDLTKDGKNFLAQTKQMWNGRTWHEVNEMYRHMLMDLLNGDGVPEKYHYDAIQARSFLKDNYPGINPYRLQKALKYIPEEHWQWWAKTYLGNYSQADVRDAMKPLTPAQKMEKVRHGLIGIVKYVTGSGDSGIDKTAPVSMLEDYYSWRRIFEEDGMTESIFQTGYLPKAYQMKDNASPLDPEGFKWKNDSAIVDEVNKFIISQYPGSKTGAMADWRKYFEVMNPAMKELYQKLDFVSVWKINPDMQKKIENVIEGVLGNKLEKPTEKQMKDIFVLKTGTVYGDVPLIALDKLNPVIQKVIFKMYNDFDFVKYLVNYTKYRIKIDFTRDTFNMTGGYMLNDDYRLWLSKHLGLSSSTEFDKEVKDLERTTNLIIGNGQNKNGTSSSAINLQSNGTITDVIHFNVFKLVQIMLMEANNAQENFRQVGKVDTKE